jgi:hypothetical protein
MGLQVQDAEQSGRERGRAPFKLDHIQFEGVSGQGVHEQAFGGLFTYSSHSDTGARFARDDTHGADQRGYLGVETSVQDYSA